jgi:hypothetical protein
MKGKLFLIIIVIASLAIPFVTNVMEPFSLGSMFPKNILREETYESDILIQDTFPLTGNANVSDKQSADVWWKYPIFKVGSYAQVTNNIKYPKNPDIGRCTRIEMCDALYENRANKSNVVVPLPPVEPSMNPRVGYFNSSM